MAYEIDFLPVGEASQSGDAIALRFGNFVEDASDQFVVIIDGGFQSCGEALVEHIGRWYRTDHVNLVISTHPDADHAAGLAVVLEQLQVDELWMHQPWNHTDDIARLFQHGRVTDAGVRESLRRSLENARTLDEIATRNGIPITEPFTGLRNRTGHLKVVGPSEEFYEGLLPEFRGTPEPAAESGLVARAAQAVREAIQQVAERWDFETLTDDGATSAENNTSTILLLEVDEHALLLTADAGIPALTDAADVLDARGVQGRTPFKFVQVPHHGSRRNVGPTVLDRLLGPRLAEDTPTTTAYLSAAIEGAPKHPSKRVTNAFKRRGAQVFVTQGRGICYRHESPGRPGWGPIDPLPLYHDFEE